MSTKWTLNIAAMQEEFFTDTALIGIVSALPAYRFCWLMNQKFDMNFTRDAELDVCLQTKPNERRFFSLYSYSMPLNGSRYLIYKLKSDKEVLLPEVKQLDYLWMIQSNSHETDAANISQYLRDIPDVQLAQVLVPEKLKNLNHLLV